MIRFNSNSDQQKAQEQVLELLPMIGEVNAVSEELNKYRHFELVLISDPDEKETRYWNIFLAPKANYKANLVKPCRAQREKTHGLYL